MSPRSRLTLLVALSAGCLALLGVPALAAGTTYYVNCAAASDGNGSSTSPWNNLATVNSKTFAPGDSLLFNRGTTCTGSSKMPNSSICCHASGGMTERATRRPFRYDPMHTMP